MIDELLIKISGLIVIQNLLAVVKINITRFIIKNQFGSSEITLMSWFTWDFIQTLSASKVMGLGIIAAFTLITFPLGVWIGSFKLGVSLPLTMIIGLVVGMVTMPLQLLTINKTVNEMALNNHTLIGVALLEIGYMVLIGGWWFIYTANQVPGA